MYYIFMHTPRIDRPPKKANWDLVPRDERGRKDARKNGGFGENAAEVESLASFTHALAA